MSAQDEIDTLKKKYEDKLKSLQEKADAEKKEQQRIRDAELADIAKNGRKRAMDALLSLDADEIFTVEDRKFRSRYGGYEDALQPTILLNMGSDEPMEVAVSEEFESNGWRQTKGASKGFWYSVDSYRYAGKRRRWKKPESAYEKLKEIRDSWIAEKAREAERDDLLKKRMAEVKALYPDHKVVGHGQDITVGPVTFSAMTDKFIVSEIRLYGIDHDTRMSLANIAINGVEK